MESFCIAPGPAGPVLPSVKKSAVPEKGMAPQCLLIENGVRAVRVPGDGAALKRLLDQLFSPQLVPLIGDAGVLVVPLMVHLHHLALDKPVAAGAPGDGARGQRRLVGVVLVQDQGVCIEGVSFGVEQHRQFRLPQRFPPLGPGQVDGRHLPAAPGAGQPGLVPQIHQGPVLLILGPCEVGAGLLVPAAGSPQIDPAQSHQIARPAEKQVVGKQAVHGLQVLCCHCGPAVQDLALLFGIAHPAHPLRRSRTDPAGSRPGPALAPPG